MENPDKTDDGEWITSYECDHAIAEQEFLFSKRQYAALTGRKPKGNHAFIVCTHVDRLHLHSHIFFNSTSLDCSRKFRNFWRSSFAVRKISDLLCLENALSVIENPKPSRAATALGWVTRNHLPSGRSWNK